MSEGPDLASRCAVFVLGEGGPTLLATLSSAGGQPSRDGDDDVKNRIQRLKLHVEEARAERLCKERLAREAADSLKALIQQGTLQHKDLGVASQTSWTVQETEETAAARLFDEQHFPPLGAGQASRVVLRPKGAWGSNSASLAQVLRARTERKRALDAARTKAAVAGRAARAAVQAFLARAQALEAAEREASEAATAAAAANVVREKEERQVASEAKPKEEDPHTFDEAKHQIDESTGSDVFKLKSAVEEARAAKVCKERLAREAADALNCLIQQGRLMQQDLLSHQTVQEPAERAIEHFSVTDNHFPPLGGQASGTVYRPKGAWANSKASLAQVLGARRDHQRAVAAARAKVAAACRAASEAAMTFTTMAQALEAAGTTA